MTNQNELLKIGRKPWACWRPGMNGVKLCESWAELALFFGHWVLCLREERAIPLLKFFQSPSSVAALGKMRSHFAKLLFCLSPKLAVNFFLPTLSHPGILSSACLLGLDSLQDQDPWNLSPTSKLISAGRQVGMSAFNICCGNLEGAGEGGEREKGREKAQFY